MSARCRASVTSSLVPVVSAIVIAVIHGAFTEQPAYGALVRFDNDSADGTWETTTNWSTDALPTGADQAVVGGNSTVSVSTSLSTQPGEVVVSWPNDASGAGTATLNIQGSAVFQSTTGGGIRVGRSLGAGEVAGSSKGVVNQTAGAVTLTNTTNGLRLSQSDAGLVADSLYQISGGSLRGGATNDAGLTAPLNIGRADGDFNRAEFWVNGSGATEIRFEDVVLTPPTGGTGTGLVVLHFTLDDGGVTPIVAEDELRIVSQTGSRLEIDLAGLPPESNIDLILADRLTNSMSPLTYTPFESMPDGTAIVREFGGFEYTWLLRYFEDSGGGDNGVIGSFVRLEFQSKLAVIPEVSSIFLVGLISILSACVSGMWRRRVS